MTMEDLSGDAEMVAEFAAFLETSLDTMRELQREASAGGYDPEAIDTIYNLSHNIKGMGATFGFDLTGQIAQNFCRYIKLLNGEKSVDQALVDAHVKAFDVTIGHKITGMAGFRGEQIIGRLKARVDTQIV